MTTEQTNSGETCRECGAPAIGGMSCWRQLGALIAWEYDDPDLLAEHFLTVACYNLQHPAQFADSALAGLRMALIDRLEHQVPVAQLRRRAGRAYAGAARVLKPAAERRPELRRWSITIADVYLPDRQAGAAERVRQWAAAVHSEL